MIYIHVTHGILVKYIKLVFGLASLENKTGVFSFARYDSKFFSE